MAEERAQTKEKRMQTLGWVATAMSVMMYVSYIPQIIGNLHGNKGDFIQPSVAAVNCTLWVIYGLCKEKRDLPLAGQYSSYLALLVRRSLSASFQDADD